MRRSTPYAIELASADFAGCRIERLLIKSRWLQVIRFSDWRYGWFRRKALVVPEDELLILMGDAIAAGVFSRPFLNELLSVLTSQLGDSHA